DMCVFSCHRKSKEKSRQSGMTVVEALVVMVILAILVSMLLPSMARPRHSGGNRLSCVNNLKQIGTAYRIWQNDNGDKFPMQQDEALGGMKDILSGSTNAGQYACLSYAIMQNELGQ